ncbi:MAG TPA: SpvB/TcaC N-terminal domain-containing protein, partial [Nocardioides sp.]|nr:SpvB/TcaC N-terminal domain-containing protein [Nocardioides sp.]
MTDDRGAPRPATSAPSVSPAGASKPSGSDAAPAPSSLLPAITLPKGGGAIRGIGDKLEVNAATGTGTFTVPLAISPGRGGLTPDLSLRYDSSGGNGPFGLGWRLSIPAIARKTDKGLPHYDDTDVFVLSGAEDLVPVLVPDGDGTRPDVLDRDDHRVQRFRPRVEGLFARIERWTHRTTGDVHWRTITRENVLSVYGRSPDARIADPTDARRVFSWLLEETRDDRGNVVCYRYKQEDGVGVDRTRLSEASRLGPGGFNATAQRYLKRVLYGNRTPLGRNAPVPTDASAWLFEVVLDYGEHDDAAPTPDGPRPWAVRADPFSTYRATFEVRTYRQCRRVLMFHRFPELGPEPCLVRSTDLEYQASQVRSADGTFDGGMVAAQLASVTHAGYVRSTDGPYERATLPAVELGYSQPVIHDAVRTVDRDDLAGLPAGLAAGAHWVDLDGEGIPGALLATDRAWFYKANLGDGRLAAPALQRALPAPAELAGGVQQLADLDGDGRLDLVRYAPPLAGTFERTPEAGWTSFVPISDLPTIDWDDPNLRLVDLDGDGLADLLITEHQALRWYRSRGTDGFDRAARIPAPRDERDGPAVVFADGTETIHLADMSGDGLVDLVRVRNGEVCYWPNLGHGRFGRKVTLEGSPRFDSYHQFDAGRIRLADIDGSGPSDIAYLGADGIRIYFNRSGNALSAPMTIRSLPRVDSLASLAVVDFLGHGTSCLVWSSAGPAHANRPLAFVDLLADGKPHLLTSVVNNLGGETRLRYAPSTRFYLEDKVAGRPWLTRLPFPVHLVERVEHADQIAGTRLVTRYRYHHGYYDGHERELGGFACVEQWDAESFVGAGGTGDADLVRPPVRTVTWFHTGAWLEREQLERALAKEYYQGDPDAPLLADTRLPPGLSVREERQAAGALRGAVLRQEVYAEDGTPEAVHPYVVSERDHVVRVLQRAPTEGHAVFLVHPGQAIEFHYERRPHDPRIGHELVLAVDEFGNITQAASIAYPRRAPAEPEQARLWATVTDARFAHLASGVDTYRVGVPIEAITTELTGLVAPATGVLPTADVIAAIAAAAEIPFEAEPAPGMLARRTIGRQRQRYYADDLSGPLPLGLVEPRALPYESYAAAFTRGLLAGTLGDRIDDAVLANDGRYQLEDGLWWAPSGRVVPAPTHFYVPTEAVDPFGGRYVVRYDEHALLLIETEDPLGNRVTTTNDYRVLAPALVTDPNGNRSAAAFDALGMVVCTAVMGKPDAPEGDTLEAPTTRLEYDLHRWRTAGKPAYLRTLAREQHADPNTRWLETYTYTDGSGRVAMTKARVDPGPVPGGGHADPRWVGTGRTVFDNKGNPVKQYEPFFSATSDFEDEAEIVEWGVTPILRYDPLGRLIRTDLPDGTHSKVAFDTWRVATWDAGDVVAETPWLARMQAGSPAEQRAAALSLGYAATPAVAHLDALGRTFLTAADAGPAGLRLTRVVLDIAGNPLRIVDPRGVVAAESTFDLLGRALVIRTADAGESFTLGDVAGKPVRAWHARGTVHRPRYDALQRPTHLFVRQDDAPEQLVQRTVYGEAHPDAAGRNLRSRPHLAFDTAGFHETILYDFKGNPLGTTRRLAADFRTTPDWLALAELDDLAAIVAAAEPFLDAEAFTITARYDALNRPVSRTTPDGSETLPRYNEAGLLDQLAVRVRAAETPTVFVGHIDYNARGQRERVAHGNGTVTTCAHDPLTFRLTSLRTVRTSGGAVLQDLAYTYDAVGNIVQMSDVVSFGNPTVSADGRYTYDAVYQLVEAEGREHPGQQPIDVDPSRLRLSHPEDMQALRRYRELYAYDPAGNLTEMAHAPLGAGPPGWTRAYDYAAESNRLLATSAPGDAPGTRSHLYAHDAAGHMTAMPHLAAMEWDHARRLRRADRGGGGTVHFVYDGAGERVRKVYEHGANVDERIYLDGIELYRRRNAATGQIWLERQTLHVRDATDCIALVETKTVDLDTPGHTPTPRHRYQLSNHLGSAAMELDADAAVISYEEYLPYGGTA